MSAYDSDPRVRFNPDGTVTLPGGEHGDWQVMQVDGVWVAAHPKHLMLQDRVDGNYAAGYRTCDEVIEHLLGPAIVPV